jgi:hypothetical protein
MRGDGVLEQPRLADSGLAVHDQRRAQPLGRGGTQQSVDPLDLVGTTEQHGARA